jgi:hypothetical protein
LCQNLQGYYIGVCNGINSIPNTTKHQSEHPIVIYKRIKL